MIRSKDGHHYDGENVLEVENLSIEFRTEDDTVYAVNDVSLTLKRRRTLGIVGETGAGKTTTMLSLLKLVPDPPGVIKNGSIFLDGKDIMNLPQKELEAVRGHLASMIFQDPMTSLNPVFTCALPPPVFCASV